MEERTSDDRSVVIIKRERSGERNAANINWNLFSSGGTSGSMHETPPSCIIHPASSLQEQDLYFTSISSCDRSFMKIISLWVPVGFAREAAAADSVVRLFHSREKL